MLTFKKTNQNTREVKNESFLISTILENFQHITLLLTKRQNVQTDVKREMRKKLSCVEDLS